MKRTRLSMLPLILLAMIAGLVVFIAYFLMQPQRVSGIPASSALSRPEDHSSSGEAAIVPPEAGAVPAVWMDGGIFSDSYDQAIERLESMTLEEKLGQVFLTRCPRGDAAAVIRQYQPSGIVLFGRDFKGKSAEQVRQAVDSYQQAAGLPMLVAVDEEGGTVVRISSNPKLAETPFRSPMQIYQQGGLEAIRQDTAQKAELLRRLGINLNLAPVCDVSTDPNDYIYSRTLGKGAEETAEYAKAVVEASAAGGIYSALKHFPGYGNNVDTHTGISVDKRELSSFEKTDFLPFQAGIAAGAESVLVSHNIVEAIDAQHPASLSAAVHATLREKLRFTGLIMTDDLAMDAIGDYTGNQHPVVAALLAGNDLLLVDDLPGSITALRQALEEGSVSEELLDHAVFRILAMKLHTGLLK